MATHYFQAFDAAFTGSDFSGSDRYTCRVIVPFVHKLVTAKLYAQNVVTTGTVTVTLKQSDVNDGRGGAIVGTAFANADLEDWSTTNKEFAFTLASADKATAPANRHYFLIITATNAADRVDEPLLLIEVTD